MTIELQTNISLIPRPAAPSHLVSVEWVEAFVAGLQKLPVQLVATVPQTGSFNVSTLEFTYTALTPTTIDGVIVTVGDAVLFTGQTADPEENLIYECTQAGDGTVPTILKVRDEDLATGASTTVEKGDDHADQTWRLTTQGSITIGVTALTWEPFVPPKTTQVFTEDFDLSTGTATGTIPPGMEWEIAHGLNSENVSVQIYNNGNNSLVFADVVTARADGSSSTNILTIRFAAEPAPGATYRAVVIG